MADAKKIAAEGAERVAGLFPGWRVSSEAIDDSPYWAFIERARQLHSNLIISGSRGRSTFEAAILGSVSLNLLHYAPCSVRVARSPISAARGKHSPVAISKVVSVPRRAECGRSPCTRPCLTI